jgi:hypothetical protein
MEVVRLPKHLHTLLTVTYSPFRANFQSPLPPLHGAFALKQKDVIQVCIARNQGILKIVATTLFSAQHLAVVATVAIT